MTNLRLSDFPELDLAALKQLAQSEASGDLPYPSVDATEIRALRSSLKLSQQEFAGIFPIGQFVIREWEIGTRKPDRTAAFLIQSLAQAIQSN